MNNSQIINCKNYPKIFGKDFTIIDQSIFQVYTLVKNNTSPININLNNNSNNNINLKNIVVNVCSCQGAKLKLIRQDDTKTNLLSLDKTQLYPILDEIVKEIKLLKYTHLYYIEELGPFYDSTTFNPVFWYSVHGYRVLGDKNDGLKILNDYIKNKKWYKKLNNNIEPFFVYYDRDNKLENFNTFNDNRNQYLTFNRLCAWEIYSKNDISIDSHLEKMDLYLIEIINKQLEEYNVLEILFKNNNINDFDGVFDKLYFKLRNKWILNPKIPIINYKL